MFEILSRRAATLPALVAIAILCALPLHGQGSHENWSGWATLDGQIASSAPAVARNGDDRLEVFIRNPSGQLYHRAQESAGSDSWTDWSSLESGFAGNPVAIADSDGRIFLFVRGANNVLYRKWQWAPGGQWSQWYAFDGLLEGDPSVVLYQGRLHVFVHGTDHLLYFKSQLSAGDPFAWSSWVNLGGGIRSNPAAVVSESDGRLEVFVRGTNDALHYRSYSGSWSGWIALGGVVLSDPVAVSTASGVEVVVRGSDSRLSYRSRSFAEGWGPWVSLGGPVTTSDPAIGVNADGRLELFVRGSDGAIHHNYQGTAIGSYTGWSSLGGIPAAGGWDIAVARNLDGRLQIFIRASDSALDHAWQVIPGG